MYGLLQVSCLCIAPVIYLLYASNRVWNRTYERLFHSEARVSKEQVFQLKDIMCFAVAGLNLQHW